MLPLNSNAIREARDTETQNVLQEAEKQLGEITSRISQLSAKVAKKGQQSSSSGSAGWTGIYEKCSDWQDMEDLKEKEVAEKAKIESLLTKQDTLGHYHDHTKEREFFEQPEDEKIKQCHINKDMGNYLFFEGNYERAIDRYQVAICYYEYCFPEDPALQAQLDAFRHTCLCNLALCQIRRGLYRNAIDSASRVLIETKLAKAHYLKGKAHCLLDEFDMAMNELRMALELEPADPAIREEIRFVGQRQEGYRLSQQEFAANITRNSSGEARTGGEREEGEAEEEDVYIAIFDDDRPLEPMMPLFVQEHNLKLSKAPKSTRW